MKKPALLSLSLLAACGTADVEPAETAASAVSTPRVPALAHLPPGIDDFYDGGCVAGRVPGCTLLTHSGRSSTRAAKEVYDAFFAAARPASVEGFGWEPAPEVPALVETVRLPELPWGSVAEIASSIALSPETPRFSRTDERPNLEIFTELRATRPGLFEGRHSEPYELYDARDWMPSALTHYQAPTATSDIMATNFVYRIVMQPWRMEQALADCTKDADVPCIDAVAALSSVDIGRVLDVRFLRWVDGAPMKSRRYRVVVVDSGHKVQSQAVLGPNENGSPYIMTNHGGGPSLLWRAEIGGSLSTRLATGPGASGALLAYSESNGRGDAERPPSGACTDLNDGEWRCGPDAGGIEKTWKCMRRAWTPAAWGCRLP